jgi:protein involved in polysaccharide export with SLBB domain
MKLKTVAKLAIIANMVLGGCAYGKRYESESTITYVYKLGAGDKLHISTFGEDNLTGDFIVNGDGNVSFPLVGDVPSAGKTVSEFRQELTEQLGSTYLRNPRVTAEVINYRPVFILGEVMHPGEFAYADKLTVYAVVAKAGGFTYRAKQNSAFIRRENGTAETEYSLTSSTAVQPGDTIRIGQRLF